MGRQTGLMTRTSAGLSGKNLEPRHPADARKLGAQAIRFESPLRTAKGCVILRLPKNASQRLPSRGQVAVRGTINGCMFQIVVEPDGAFGHWMKVEASLQRVAGVRAGDTATVEVEPVEDWPEPSVPPDLRRALRIAPRKVHELWAAITPMARWEWVRWVNATRNPETRQRRVEVAISKMSRGNRRPCCFNLAACTDPDLSRSGKLVGSA